MIHYAEQRTPITIARKWWSMVKMFCLLVASFSSPSHDSFTSTLAQITRTINNPDSPDTPGLKRHDLVAWTTGGEKSWLGLAYSRFVFKRVL